MVYHLLQKDLHKGTQNVLQYMKRKKQHFPNLLFV